MRRALLFSMLLAAVVGAFWPSLRSAAAAAPDVFLVYSGGVFGQLGPCG